MAKTKEELNEIKQEYEAFNLKARELSEDELNQITGGNLNPVIARPYLEYKVIDSIGKKLNVKASTITLNSRFEELGADSLDVVDIVKGLNENFEINIVPERTRVIEKVGDIVELVERR